MNQQTRGIYAVLKDGGIKDVLEYLQTVEMQFWLSWAMIGPFRSCKQMLLSASELETLSSQNLWELVLHMYPDQSMPAAFESYEAFLNSDCSACLIYYDCRMIELYIKSNVPIREELFSRIEYVSEEFGLITDYNDTRTALTL